MDPAALTRVLASAYQAMREASFWLLLGFLISGLAHEFLPREHITRAFGARGLKPVLAATGLSAMLPLCSCGVVPVAIGMYRTGASLGAVLAFMCAGPVVNPASLLLSLGLLGGKITLVYAVTGLGGAVATGLAANRWGGAWVFAPGCGPDAGPAPLLEAAPRRRFLRRLADALRWGFLDLGAEVAFYVLIGLLLAGVVGGLVPGEAVSRYVGPRAGVAGLLVVLALAAPLYVCATGSIPLVAEILTKGAAPGAAIVFLMGGPATNIPEVLAIWRLMGRRPALLYTGLVTSFALAGGLAAHLLLSPEAYFLHLFEIKQLHHTAWQDFYLASTSLGGTLAYFNCGPQDLISMPALSALMALGLWRRIQRAAPGAARSPLPSSEF